MSRKVYVSPVPCGDGSGKTPENACGLTEAFAGTGSGEIELLPGRYALEEPLNLNGLSDVTVIGNGAVLTGGTPVSGWRLGEDGLAVADVDGDADFERLYVNGSPRRRASCPANGFYLADKSPVRNGWANEYGFETADRRCMKVKPEDFPDEFALPDDHPDGVEFVVLQFWCEARLRPEKFDRENSAICFTGEAWRPLSWSFGWYMDNHPAGLTEPGSWYHDRKKGVLKYRLLPGESVETLSAEYPRLKRLLTIEGGKNIVWKDVTFSCTDADVPAEGYSITQAELDAPDTVHLDYASGGGFFGCRFENLGGCALAMEKGCRDLTVERCVFTGCGAGAVCIGTGKIPPNEKDRTGGVTVKNCRISGLGSFYLGPAAIWIGQSGDNRILHNDITGQMQWAVSVGWCWSVFPVSESCRNRIEYNYIHEIGTGVLGTHGALYCLGVSPETVFAHNLVRNVYANEFWGAGEGIILDNGCSGVTIRDNIVVNASAGGWGCNFNCFGCVIMNNIFAFGSKYQLTRYGDPPDTQTPPPNGEVFSRNIVLYEGGRLFSEADWYSYSTYWDYNLYWNYGGEVKLMKFTPEEWQAHGLDVHSVFADPGFADARGGDFTLAEDSPARKIGFRPIDLSDVGIEE